MIRFAFLAVVLAVVLAGCATAPDRPGPTSSATTRPSLTACTPNAGVQPGHLAHITVTPEEAGTWLVAFAFAEPESALVFASSAGDYRRATWTPLDTGVRLVREGAYDTVLFDQPSTSARFRVAPPNVVVHGNYSPVLTFSDGAQAVYVRQFELLRVADAEAAAALQTLRDWRGEQLPVTLTLDTEATLVTAGEKVPGPACFDSRESTYVYMGLGEVTEGRSYVGIVDPGLPAWLESTFDQDLYALFGTLEEAFGSPLPQRANLLFAYGGPDEEGISLKGSVLPGLTLALEVGGDKLGTPSDALRATFLSFFAHEGAHLFQMRAGTVETAENWIHEGHAVAVADRLILEETLGALPDPGPCRDALQSGEPLPTVLASHPYGCGARVWSLADRLAPRDDLYSLWDRLAETVGDAQADSEHVLSVLRAAGARGPLYDALALALRGGGDVDLVSLLDPEED